jgi:hypothetical protein
MNRQPTDISTNQHVVHDTRFILVDNRRDVSVASAQLASDSVTGTPAAEVRPDVLARTVFRPEMSEPSVVWWNPSACVRPPMRSDCQEISDAPSVQRPVSSGSALHVAEQQLGRLARVGNFAKPALDSSSSDAAALSGARGRVCFGLRRGTRAIARAKRLHFAFTRPLRGPSQLFGRFERARVAIPVVGSFGVASVDAGRGGVGPARVAEPSPQLVRIPAELLALLIPSGPVAAYRPDGTLVRSHTRRCGAHTHRNNQRGGLAS